MPASCMSPRVWKPLRTRTGALPICEQRLALPWIQHNVIHAELACHGAIVMPSTAGLGGEPFRSLPAGGRLVYCTLDEVDSL